MKRIGAMDVLVVLTGMFGLISSLRLIYDLEPYGGISGMLRIAYCLWFLLGACMVVLGIVDVLLNRTALLVMSGMCICAAIAGGISSFLSYGFVFNPWPTFMGLFCIGLTLVVVFLSKKQPGPRKDSGC